MKTFGRVVKGPTTPGQRKLEDVLAADQTHASNAVWATVPTTHAGRLALVEYAEFQAELYYGAKWQAAAKQDVFGDIAQALGAAIRAELAGR